MSLTSTGLTIRRYPQIQSEIRQAILQNVSPDIIFDQDVLMSQLVDIVASEVASLEEVIQSVYDSLDRDKAEGTSLDSLLYLIGLRRSAAAKSGGLQQFTGNEGSTIPKGSTLVNPSSGDRFETLSAYTLTQEDCLSVVFTVDTVSDSTAYTVNLNGGVYTHTSPASGTTAVSIIAGLISEINTPSRTWEASSLIDPDRLVISTTDGEKLTITVDSGLVPEVVTSTTLIQALEFGPLLAPKNSVTQVITALGGVSATTNTEALGVGRLRETDEDFRQRASDSLSLSGSATVPALTAALLNIQSVSSVIVEENTTGNVVGGRPSHSFECIVTAPASTEVDKEIANVIWQDKPAGIQSFGNISEVIVDSSGRNQTVHFSRPTAKFIAVRVTYTLYDEEVFPINGNQLIVDSVVSTGNTFGAGKDVIPKRFNGPIYASVDGISDLVIECQVLAESGDAPAGWSTANIPIGASESSSFNIVDVYPVGP